jgi:hypothetical protein
MPRTIERIVNCHRAAASRRAQGKSSWAATVSFKGILPDGCEEMPTELTDEQIASLGKNYARYLRVHPFIKPLLNDDFELSEIVDMFESISPVEELKMTAEQDFDERLDSLYDWADDNRVWIER